MIALPEITDFHENFTCNCSLNGNKHKRPIVYNKDVYIIGHIL